MEYGQALWEWRWMVECVNMYVNAVQTGGGIECVHFKGVMYACVCVHLHIYLFFVQR